jgi:hypothetical protein
VDEHVTVRQLSELGAIVVDATPNVVEAGASELVKVAAVADRDVPAFQDLPVFVCPDESNWRTHGFQRRYAGLAARCDPVPSFPREAEPMQLLLHSLSRAWSIGDEN